MGALPGSAPIRVPTVPAYGGHAQTQQTVAPCSQPATRCKVGPTDPWELPHRPAIACLAARFYAARLLQGARSAAESLYGYVLFFLASYVQGSLSVGAAGKLTVTWASRAR